MNDKEAELAPPAVKEPSMFDLAEWTGALPAEAQRRHEEPIVGIRFQAVGKVYHYNAAGYPDLKVGAWVVVDTARGRQMGQVATLKPPRNHGGPYKRIERLAAGRDMAMRHFYERKELEAMINCRAESAALKLPIKIVRAEYAFDGQTVTFLYSADQEDRVETGVLREKMSHLYQARLEFRQISPREVAKILGGMGACGMEERCCSKFITEFSPISIKHAKEQNLSLNPNDITGMCGRLRCCLVFEYEQYVAAKNTLPKLKSVVGTPLGEGKVVELLHLRDSVRVKVGEGMETRIVSFHREQLVPLEALKKLQDKALSGTCDKHEGGGCDCGHKGARPGSSANPRPAAEPAPDLSVVPNEAPNEMQTLQDSFSDATTPSAPRPPRPRDPQQDARIKARQETLRARSQEKQTRREEQRKQLKAKAQLGRAEPSGEVRPDDARPTPARNDPAGPNAARQNGARQNTPRQDRRDPRPPRSDRPDRAQQQNAQPRPNAAPRPDAQQRPANRRPLPRRDRPPQQPRRDTGSSETSGSDAGAPDSNPQA